MFTFKSKVRFSEINERGNLSLSHMLNYFQDCSVFQTENTIGSLGELRNRGYAWVVASYQVIINRFPKLCDDIEIGTIPYNFKGFLGSRNFIMYDDKGETLAIANSLWTFMDINTMKPTRIPEEIGNAYPIEDRLEMDYTSRKIRLPEGEEYSFIEDVTVGRHHIDINGHVNNNAYLQIATASVEDMLDLDTAKSVRVEYRAQAHLHDLIRVSHNIRRYEENSSEICTVFLGDENDAPYCVVEITL